MSWANAHLHSQGDEWISALNGNDGTETYLQDRYAEHTLSRDFWTSYGYARTNIDLHCTGWSVLEAGSQRSYFLAGILQRQFHDGTKISKRVSGAGFSWQEAAFFLVGEAIERDAQAMHGVKSEPGSATAFGLTYRGAATRAILEAIERHYFRCTFLNQTTPAMLDVSDTPEISEMVASLAAAGHLVCFFSLACGSVFHVVLAVHMAGDRTTCGLGCSFDQRHAIQKALLEAVKCDIYVSQSENFSSDIDLGAMSLEASRTISFWLQSDNRKHLNFLWGGENKKIERAATTLPDEDYIFDSLIDWGETNGVSINVRTLLSQPGPRSPVVCLVKCDWPNAPSPETASHVKTIPLPIF